MLSFPQGASDPANVVCSRTSNRKSVRENGYHLPFFLIVLDDEREPTLCREVTDEQKEWIVREVCIDKTIGHYESTERAGRMIRINRRRAGRSQKKN